MSKQFLTVKIFLLMLLGTFTWTLTMFKSGLGYDFGMGFWGANGHDGIWHIALIESLSRGSWENPVFAGESLKNYHIGFDLIVSLIHKLSNISTSILYFQIIPIILSFLIGVLTYKFVRLWTGSVKGALWGVFFVYFGGDLGWVVTYLRNGNFGGESMFWAQQSISTLINPPFALSLVLILVGLILLIKLAKSKSLILYLLSFLVFGLLIEIKAYAGALILGGLLVGGVVKYLKEKDLTYLKVFAGSTLVSLILILIFNKNFENLFVFQPFWFLETMIGGSDRVGWYKLSEAMLSYKIQGVVRKFIPAYLLAFVIFWIGNMGTRLIKDFDVIRFIKNPKSVTPIYALISSVILAGVAIPMLFLQKGTPWNTIQFFYYSLFFSGILAGVALSKMALRPLAVFIIVILTLPTAVSTLLNNYIPPRPPAMLSSSELEALEFLSKEKNGIVLTYPFDKSKADAAVNNPPRPLYLYESTAYVSAFGKKPVFLEDEVNLNITNYDWRVRRTEVEEFLDVLNQTKAREFLKSNNISYIYWVKPQRAKLGEAQLGLTRIFENKEVDIYKVE